MSARKMLYILVISCVILECTATWYQPGYQPEECVDEAECSCIANGNWPFIDGYYKLEDIEADLLRIEHWTQNLDLKDFVHQINAMEEKINNFEKSLEKISVDDALVKYADYEKELAELTDTVNVALNNGSKENELLGYESQLDDIIKSIDEMWKKNPYAEQERLNEEISSLKVRLANSQEMVNDTYFPGDHLALHPADDGWCKKYELDRIGDSLAHATSTSSMGNWFKDPHPIGKANITNVYSRGYTAYHVSGYFTRTNNYIDFLTQHVTGSQFRNTKTYGMGYMMYNGSLFYHDVNVLYKYTLASGALQQVQFVPSSTEYLRHSSITRVDMKSDEFGLYAIYTSSANDEKLIVAKINPQTLHQEKSWLTNRHKSTVCATFMICGIMYTIDNCWSRVESEAHHKQYMYNTLTGEEGYINLHVTAKFGHIWMLGYNPRERRLFSWDNNHLVTYPIVWKSRNATSTDA